MYVYSMKCMCTACNVCVQHAMNEYENIMYANSQVCLFLQRNVRTQPANLSSSRQARIPVIVYGGSLRGRVGVFRGVCTELCVQRGVYRGVCTQRCIQRCVCVCVCVCVQCVHRGV